MQKIKFTKFELAFKIVLTLLVVSIFCFTLFCENILLKWFGNGVYVNNITGDFEVCFIDAGQGDCSLIRYKDMTFVIDVGDTVTSSVVSGSIKKVNHDDTIDYLILTHPDSDHVGGAEKVFQDFEVKNLLRPKVLTQSENQSEGKEYLVDTSETYLKAINSAYSEENCIIYFTSACTIFENEEFSFEILYPTDDEELSTSSNDYSAVVMAEYKGYKYLFMADAGTEIENKLIEKYGDKLNCDVLKVAHHGSKYSTSEKFLSATSPSYSIISVGEEGIKEYDHASEELKNRINSFGSAIYMTSEFGSIMFGENGDTNLCTYKVFPSVSYALVSVVCGLSILLIWGIRIKSKEKKE